MSGTAARGVARASESRHPATHDLDLWDATTIVDAILAEDLVAVRAAAAVSADVGAAVDAAHERLVGGGTVHAFGAGASGRLANLDAAEVTPTFGAPSGLFRAHFPGGAAALVDPGIDLEDSDQRGAADAEEVTGRDVVLGVTASGGTPYVLGALRRARDVGALTVLVTTTPDAALARWADHVLCADTGPEVLTGSTRLKAGTATKVLLTAFSTALMIRSGRAYSNLMVDVVVTNRKLRERAVSIVATACGLSDGDALHALDRSDGDVKVALVHVLGAAPVAAARSALSRGGDVRRALALLAEGSES